MATTSKSNYTPDPDVDGDGFDVVAIVEEKIGRIYTGGYGSGSAIEEAFKLVGGNIDDHLLVGNDTRKFVFVVDGYKVVVDVDVTLTNE